MGSGLTLLRVRTALHSVVGLAAVLTSIGSVLAEVGHASTLHVRILLVFFLIDHSLISGFSSSLLPISASSLAE
jgi:NAD(P) transhydrogenase